MMFASARPMGHFAAPQVKMATMTLQAVQMELERHKVSPMIMVEGYLDCLNRWVLLLHDLDERLD